MPNTDDSRLEANRQFYPGEAACDNQLTINGAVVARELRLGRTNGDVVDAEPQEQGELQSNSNTSTTVRVSAQTTFGQPEGQRIRIFNGDNITGFAGVSEFQPGVDKVLTRNEQIFEFETPQNISSIIVRLDDDAGGDATINYVEVEGVQRRRIFSNDSSRVQIADWDKDRGTCGADILRPSTRTTLFCGSPNSLNNQGAFLYDFSDDSGNPIRPPNAVSYTHLTLPTKA